MSLSCSSALCGGGTNQELAHHCLYECKGDILVSEACWDLESRFPGCLYDCAIHFEFTTEDLSGTFHLPCVRMHVWGRELGLWGGSH